MNQHKKFILTPVLEILEEAVLSIKHIGHGIETYPLSDYILQSIFIKMTGAQEQKLKCIAWELASNDFQFRIKFLQEWSDYGFSSYKHKNNLYQEMIRQIKFVMSDFKIKNIDKKTIFEKSCIKNFIEKTNLIFWSGKNYSDYIKIWEDDIGKNKDYEKFFLQKETVLLEQENNISLKAIYENYLYINRNRIAHNTKSYQQNLPSLEKLKKYDYQFENYFLWISILILIDNIFIELYKKYLEILNDKKFI